MRKLISFLLLVLPMLCSAQNLVPNPSFENYITCPTTLNHKIDRCANWFNPTGAYPDYYHSCSSAIEADVPLNSYGFQAERTGGNAYAGLNLYTINPDDREYIEVKLTNSLVTGKKYCVSFYVSCADSSELATSRLGAYLSVDSALGTFFNPLPFQPQVENTFNNFLQDTVNWVLVSDTLSAVGGERFLTIGNFYNDASTDTLRIKPGIYRTSVYYIDDVSLVEMVYDSANAGPDKNICSTWTVTLGTPPCSGCFYQWTASSGSVTNPTSAQPSVTPTVTTSYYLAMTDTSTGTLCDITTYDTVMVSIIPFAPHPANAGADAELCKGRSITLGTTSISTCTYSWLPASTLDSANVAQPVAFPQQTTTYTLTMIDSVPPCTQTSTDAVTVTVNDCSEIRIRNFFTPNNDGIYDTFIIDHLPPNSKLVVFNRWGNEVFRSDNYDNKWNGGKLPGGVYYYILTQQSGDVFKGFVQLIK